MVRPVLALIAVAAIIPQFVVLAASIHINNSRAAVTAGDAARARSEALAAKAIEPWAATPYLQLGLVSNAEGSNAAAAGWVDEAISRSRRDWHLWWWAARIALQRGHAGVALRDRAEACRLNPRSQFLHCD